MPAPAAGWLIRSLLLPPDLVLYCEAFLTTYRTFITPEELIQKLQYRYPCRPTLLHRAFCRMGAAMRGSAQPSSACPGLGSQARLL